MPAMPNGNQKTQKECSEMGEGRWKGEGKLAEFQVLPEENAKFLRWAVMGRAEICVFPL